MWPRAANSRPGPPRTEQGGADGHAHPGASAFATAEALGSGRARWWWDSCSEKPGCEPPPPGRGHRLRPVRHQGPRRSGSGRDAAWKASGAAGGAARARVGGEWRAAQRPSISSCKRAGRFHQRRAPGLRSGQGMPRAGEEPRAGPQPCGRSFLFLLCSQGGHTAPPPSPWQGNVWFCTGLAAAPGTSKAGTQAHVPGRRGAAGERPPPQTRQRVPREAEGRGFQRRAPLPSHLKLQAKPGLPSVCGPLDPTPSQLRPALDSHRGQHPAACGSPAGVYVCVRSPRAHSAGSPAKWEPTGLHHAPRAQARRAASSATPRRLPESPLTVL